MLLAKDDKKYLTFMMDLINYYYNVVPLGLKNTGAT